MPRWAKVAVLGVVLVCIAAGLSTWAATRGVGSGCFPGPNPSLRVWEHIDRRYRDMRGVIGPVVTSSALAGTVYANADTYGVFLGGGNPFSWHRVKGVAPDVEVSVGARRDVLYGWAWGLYRSVDGGKAWRRISCNYGGGGVAVSASDPSSLYQLGNAGDYPLNHLGGYYRSSDGGKTWSRSLVGATPYDGPQLNALAVDPANPNDVTVAPYGGGISRTTNGDDWAYTRLPGPSRPWDGQQVETLAYGARPNSVLWAGTTSGAFRTLRSGNWVRAGLRRHAVTVFPDARVASVAFAILGFNGTGRACVERTGDIGKTWLPVSALPCTVSGIAASARDGAVYAWTPHTLYRSVDHGVTWLRLPPLPVG